MRPRFLDRLGVDDRFLLVVSLLLALAIGCEMPIVPVPDPINPPVPIVPVPADGQRIVVILHETHDQSPALARLKIDLQGGESAAYFVSHHHSVFALDINAKDENKNPLPVIDKLKASIGSKPLPVLVVADRNKEGKLGNVLYCESLKSDPVPGDVVAAVKKTGGG